MKSFRTVPILSENFEFTPHVNFDNKGEQTRQWKEKEQKIDQVINIPLNSPEGIHNQEDRLKARKVLKRLLDGLSSELDFFKYRLSRGLAFNAYKNAKLTVDFTMLRDFTCSELPNNHLINMFYQGYDLWDYIYQCELAKRDSFIKSPPLQAYQGQRQSFQNHSFINQHQNVKYFQHGLSFLYSPSGQSFNPIEGIRSAYPFFKKDYKGNQQQYSIYGHTIYDDEDRQEAINACGWSQIALSRGQSTQVLHDFYGRLEQEGQFRRAAAVALCHFDFGSAIRFLESSLSSDTGQNHFHIEESTLKRHKDDLQLLLQLLQGFKNIDALLADDTQLRPYLFFKKEINKSNNFPNDNTLLQNEQLSQQELARFSNSRMLQPGFDQSEIININSPKFRIEIVKQNIDFIQQLLKNVKFEHPYLTLIQKVMQKDEELQKYLEHDLPKTNISIFDKLAIWFRFFPHDKLIKVVNLTIENAKLQGDLNIIPIVGKGDEAIHILRQYLDLTGDIQLAGSISSHLYYLDFPDPHSLVYMYYEYKHLLNSCQLYDQRVKYEIELADYEKLILQYIIHLSRCKPDSISAVIYQLEMEKQHSQVESTKIMASCNYCKKSLGLPFLESQKKTIAKRRSTATIPQRNTRDDRTRLTTCVFCATPLPKCCICTVSLGIPNIFSDQNDKAKRGQFTAVSKSKSDESGNFESAYIWCQTCRHGGHYNHLMEWFKLYNKCPVSDCQCECSII